MLCCAENVGQRERNGQREKGGTDRRKGTVIGGVEREKGNGRKGERR